MELIRAQRHPPARGRYRFGVADVLRVWFWAVLHDRPVSRAVRKENWPICLRRFPRPSDAAMSRRLRDPAVREACRELLREAAGPAAGDAGPAPVWWFMDGKPLPFGGCSGDRQAGYGRAAGGKGKGYKLHAIADAAGRLAAHRVAPMNVDERRMAKRLLRDARVGGYVVADRNYDSNKLHAVCDRRGDLQLVVGRRYGPGRGHGHRKQAPGRMRSKAILEDPFGAFGRGLLRARGCVERYFGGLTNWGGGLTHLPPWARGHRRVSRWVEAKLIANAVKKGLAPATG